MQKTEKIKAFLHSSGWIAGEVTVDFLATGALTNLFGAYLLDNDFFRKVKEIIVMGGITEPLMINGHVMEELNFSCDPEAAYCVLSSDAPTTVITGNLCLSALFGDLEINRLKGQKNVPIYGYIYQHFSKVSLLKKIHVI